MPDEGPIPHVALAVSIFNQSGHPRKAAGNMIFAHFLAHNSSRCLLAKPKVERRLGVEVGEADVHLKDLFSPEYCGWVGVDSPEEALINCKKELIEQGYDWPSSTLLESDAEEERAKLMRRTKVLQLNNVKFHERMAAGGSHRRQTHLTKCGCSVPIVFTPDIVEHDWYGRKKRSAAFEAQSVRNETYLGTADHIVDTLKRLRQRLELTPDISPASASGSEAVAIASTSASNVSARDLVIFKALEATDAILGNDARESCRILRRCILFRSHC